jgi:hypothetical protein
MAMIDPLAKAAECEREIVACSDLSKRCVLENLRQLWLNIAADKSLGKPDWHANVDDINKLHIDVLGAPE